MKKNIMLVNMLMIIIAFVPLIYLAMTWNTIPDKVTLHFDSRMQPDKTGNKSELWVPSIILACVSLLVYFLFQNIRFLDPKRRNASDSVTFNKLAAGLVIFFSVLNFLIVLSASRDASILNNFLFPLLGLLFAFIGNYMNNLKPNYFAGFRLPWTLSDDDNWRKTHHLASKLWFWGGISFAIISLFLPIRFVMPLFICIVVVMSLIPTIYSYRLFRGKA